MERGNTNTTKTKSLDNYQRLEVLELTPEMVLRMMKTKPRADPPKGG